MNKQYDQQKKCLVFWGSKANADFWDSHWTEDDFEKYVKNANNSFVINHTSKYLPKGSRILEGGCGRGDKVYALTNRGFDTYGVDYAEATVTMINNHFPELNVTIGDVRHLEFPDNFFDGYWSLGVIEHFFNGYDDISKEMYRILKDDGYLFLTVPTMSNLRKIKASFNMYSVYKEESEVCDNFYQYALSRESVVSHFCSSGFELVNHKHYDGVKGLKDEIDLLLPFLQWCYDHNSILVKVIRKSIDIAIKKLSAHMSFFVFKKLKH